MVAAGWVCVAGTAFGAEEPKPAPTCPAEIRGCWATDGKPIQYVRFEDGKCTFAAEGGGGQVLKAAYAPDKVVLSMMGLEHTVPVVAKDKTLTLGSGGEAKLFRKLDAAPDELNFDPLKLGEPKPVPADRLKTIQAELAERLGKDQAVRQPGQVDSKKMHEVDVDNTAYLRKLAAELGWIDVERFGRPASHAAFLIVQHSGDVRLMKAALPLIEKDVKAKHFDGQPYALLYDRLQLMTGGRQRYGTQITQNAQGKMVVAGLENKDKVDEFRKELGMVPLADYLKMFDSMGRGSKVRIED